jgi:hypothetical protein
VEDEGEEWGPVVPAMASHVVSLCGELLLSALEIGFALAELLESGGFIGRRGGRVFERVGVERVGGRERVLIVVG